LKVPGASNCLDQLAPGASRPESQVPWLVVVCDRRPRFVQVTLVPATTTISAGWNARSTMATVACCAAPAGAGASATPLPAGEASARAAHAAEVIPAAANSSAIASAAARLRDIRSFRTMSVRPPLAVQRRL
jgi:hypothetical protein